VQITKEEKQVLDKISEAHRAFAELEQQHPNDIRDYINGIHILQGLIMQRIARRADPNMFPTYKTKVEQCNR